MSMSVGTVTLSSLDGSGNPTTRTGSGLAVALFDAMVAAKAAGSNPIPLALPTVGSTAAPYSAARPCTTADYNTILAGRLTYFQDLATTCAGIASIVTYIQSNAAVNLSSITTVVAAGRSLGSLPAGSYVPGEAINGPATNVFLPIYQSSTNIT